MSSLSKVNAEMLARVRAAAERAGVREEFHELAIAYKEAVRVQGNALDRVEELKGHLREVGEALDVTEPEDEDALFADLGRRVNNAVAKALELEKENGILRSEIIPAAKAEAQVPMVSEASSVFGWCVGFLEAIGERPRYDKNAPQGKTMQIVTWMGRRLKHYKEKAKRRK